MAGRKEAAAALEIELGRKPYSWEISGYATRHRRVTLNDVPKGHCRWCERPIIGMRGKHIDKPDPNRSWCRKAGQGRDCWYEYRLHSDAQTQFNYLEATRGLKCAECGVLDPRRWKSLGPINYGLPRVPRGDMELHDWLAALEANRLACLAEFPAWGRAIQIELACDLQVDHVVPLWKVAMMPIEQRRPYFGPEFLALLCGPCHKRKTAEEAKERAEIRRFERAQARLL